MLEGWVIGTMGREKDRDWGEWVWRGGLWGRGACWGVWVGVVGVGMEGSCLGEGWMRGYEDDGIYDLNGHGGARQRLCGKMCA